MKMPRKKKIKQFELFTGEVALNKDITSIPAIELKPAENQFDGSLDQCIAWVERQIELYHEVPLHDEINTKAMEQIIYYLKAHRAFINNSEILE